MKILAIESSCDETAAAVIEDGRQILSNVISSQIDIHAAFGGVVPEIAARSHIEVIIPVIEQALLEASCGWEDIEAVATTRGPGLIGSLLIGSLTARVLADTYNIPLLGVNHIVAHAFAAFLQFEKNPLSQNNQRRSSLNSDQGDDKARSEAHQSVRRTSTGVADTDMSQDSPPSFPMLALTVSGGHTALTLYQEDLSFEILGETLDDAAGEAFDKVAKLLGLPYPGGPAISNAAEKGNPKAYKFPEARLGRQSLDFSFSGLKTAVLRQVQQIAGVNPGDLSRQKTYQLDEKTVSDIAASFQDNVVSTLVQKTQLAVEKYQPASVVVGGGVAANKHLRTKMLGSIPEAIFVPPVLCTDNAAMIGALAYKMHQKGLDTDPALLKADSSLEKL